MMSPAPRVTYASPSQGDKVDLSIVVPAYNEAASIREALNHLTEIAKRDVDTYEVIVVDDGSTDETTEIVRSVSRENVSVIGIRSPDNRGKGAAVKLAAPVVRGNIVVIVDGDMEIDASSLKEYLKALERFDICVASKRHPRSSYEAPMMRKFLSASFNKLIRLTTGIKLSDSQTGLKAMRGGAFKQILQVVAVKRYAYDVEILAVAQLLGLRTCESPVRIVQNAQFNKRAVMFMFVDLMGIVYRLHILHWYQRNLADPRLAYKPLIPI